MRKLLVVLVLILIIAAILPGAAGYQFKRQYLSLIAAANADKPTKINVTEYHEYWLSSDAVLTINLDTDQKSASGTTTPAEPHTLTFIQHITHGPYIKNTATGARQLALALVASQVHLEKSAEDKLNVANGVMQLNTWVSFFNNYDSAVQTPVFALKLPNQSKIIWQGMNGTVAAKIVDDRIKIIKSAFAIGPLSAQSATASFSVNSMTTQGERTCDANTLCNGSGTVMIPLMASATPEQSFKISGVHFTTQYGVNNQNAYNGDLDFQFIRFETPDYFIGPVQLKFSVNNVNAAELKKIVDISTQASTSINTSEDVRANELMLIAQVNDVAPHLITPSSNLVQSAAVKTSYGNLTENAKVFWPAHTPLPANTTDLMKANFIMNARAATSLVDQIITMMDEKAPPAAEAVATQAIAANPGSPQTFKASVFLLISQGLSPDEEKSLLALQDKNVTKQVFDDYVDSRVAIKVIPGNLAPILKQDYAASSAAMANPLQNVAAMAGANKQLDDWVRENKITIDTRTKLIALQKQHLSPEIYGASIDDIQRARRLPVDLATQLKSQYNVTASTDTGGGNDIYNSDTAGAGTQSMLAQAAGPNRLQFNNWLQAGFISQVKDEYLVAVVYQDGVLKVNGKVVPMEAQDHVPTQESAPAAQ